MWFDLRLLGSISGFSLPDLHRLLFLGRCQTTVGRCFGLLPTTYEPNRATVAQRLPGGLKGSKLSALGKPLPMTDSESQDDLIAEEPVFNDAPTWWSESTVAASEIADDWGNEGLGQEEGRDQLEKEAETHRANATDSDISSNDARSSLAGPRSPSLDATTLSLPGDEAADVGDLAWVASDSESESSAKPAGAESMERRSLRRLRVFIIENDDEDPVRGVKPRQGDLHEAQAIRKEDSPPHDTGDDSQPQW